MRCACLTVFPYVALVRKVLDIELPLSSRIREQTSDYLIDNGCSIVMYQILGVLFESIQCIQSG